MLTVFFFLIIAAMVVAIIAFVAKMEDWTRIAVLLGAVLMMNLAQIAAIFLVLERIGGIK